MRKTGNIQNLELFGRLPMHIYGFYASNNPNNPYNFCLNYFFREELRQVWNRGARVGPRGRILARAHKTRQVQFFLYFFHFPSLFSGKSFLYLSSLFTLFFSGPSTQDQTGSVLFFLLFRFVHLPSFFSPSFYFFAKGLNLTLFSFDFSLFLTFFP